MTEAERIRGILMHDPAVLFYKFGQRSRFTHEGRELPAHLADTFRRLATPVLTASWEAARSTLAASNYGFSISVPQPNVDGRHHWGLVGIARLPEGAFATRANQALQILRARFEIHRDDGAWLTVTRDRLPVRVEWFPTLVEGLEIVDAALEEIASNPAAWVKKHKEVM